MTWEEIYLSMAQRWRPEDVAAALIELMPKLKPILKQAAAGAWYGTHHWNYLTARPGFRGHSVDTTIVLRYPGLPSDPAAAIAFLTQETGLYSNDLRTRMPAPIRAQAGLTMSRRRYMKHCRILLALRRKLARVDERGAFVRWTRIAQSGWALDITMADFMATSPETRAFLAYYVARMQRQSTFSGTGQDRAWDGVANRLFEHIVPSRIVAMAYPGAKVLTSLTDDERTTLLIEAYRDLVRMAETMGLLWKELGADRNTMIVQRGMNSSDWNAIAGAWNGIRRLWISLLYACGKDDNLDRICPGKAMRLMAADVAAWHRHLGDDEGPDVKVFKLLPLPWDVVLGRATCTRRDVETAMKLALGTKGKDITWTTPFEVGKPVPTKITHSLVHGVAVSDPGLADLLRRAGWFSGKTIKKDVEGVEVERSEGFATGVSSAKERTAL
jgi:hypothetical protein